MWIGIRATLTTWLLTMLAKAPATSSEPLLADSSAPCVLVASPMGGKSPETAMGMGMAMRATLSTSPLAMLAAKGTGSASAAAPPVELPASRLNRLCALRWHIAAAPLPDYGRSKGAGLWN